MPIRPIYHRLQRLRNAVAAAPQVASAEPGHTPSPSSSAPEKKYSNKKSK